MVESSMISFLRRSWMLVIALILLFVYPLFYQFYIVPQFSSVALESSRRAAVNFATHLEEVVQIREALLADTADAGRFGGYIDDHASHFSIYKVRVYDQTGLILYSTATEEVGTRPGTGPQELFEGPLPRGEVVQNVVRTGELSAEGETLKRDVVETYVPYFGNDVDEGRRAFTGAVEVYQDVSTELAAIDNVAGNLFFFSCFVGAVLFIVALLLHSRGRDAQHSLEANERRYRSLLNNLPNPAYHVDVQGRLLGCNEAFARMVDTSERQMLGRPLAEVVHCDDAEALQQGDTRLATEGGVERFETQVHWADGTSRQAIVSKSSYADSAGRVIGIVGLLLDITEMRAAHSALMDANEHLEERVRERTAELTREVEERRRAQNELGLMAQVFEHSIEGISITDTNGKIISVNPAFSEITGYPSEEVIGQNPSVLKSDRHDAAFYEAMWHKLATEGSWSGEIWNRRKNGETYPEWLSISAIRDEAGTISHYVAVFHDITDLKRSEERLTYQAYHDALTGLPNRLLLIDRMRKAISHAHHHGHHVAVAFLDLDNFKTVNDSLGHKVGDLMLAEAARRLKRAIREDDTVARFGGDEFVLMLEEATSEQDAFTLASRVLQVFNRPFIVEGHEIHVSPSVGITMYPGDGEDADTLIRNAEVAMYVAKEQGKNRFHLFTTTVNERVQRRIEVERKLRKAVDNRAFEAHYQPQIDICTGRVVGMEALARWTGQDENPVSPAEFIPIAEEAGLVSDIGEQILWQSCELAARLRNNGHPDLRMSVNISARQLRGSRLEMIVRDVLNANNLPASALELELTETAIMQDVDKAIGALHKLKALGIHLAIDDFGTGYSSLYYLKRLPISRLKVDRSFIMDIDEDENDRSIVAAVLSMAKSLQLEVVAEGVERPTHVEFLRSLNCSIAQGYYYAKPMETARLLEFLETSKDGVGVPASS